MYLNARHYLWENESDAVETLTKVFPELNGRKVQEVIVEAVYWRKSNAIHKWFVDNVQDGNDNCGYYWVEREQLEELRQLVLEALKTKDASLLPTQSGFFFGSTDVDEWYWKDLEYTAEQLEKALNEFPNRWDFQYHSSW
jgi:hypothetical protein